MAYAYSTKHLGAGSISGRGFWLTREARFPFSDMNGLRGNTNLRLERTLEEALIFNEKLPHIGNPLSKLEIIKCPSSYISACYEMWQFYHFNNPPGKPDGPIWIKFQENELESFYGFSEYMEYLENPYEQRHVHRVLFDNKQGSFVESATRIPIGESGYTDTLPGLCSVK